MKDILSKTPGAGAAVNVPSNPLPNKNSKGTNATSCGHAGSAKLSQLHDGNWYRRKANAVAEQKDVRPARTGTHLTGNKY